MSISTCTTKGVAALSTVLASLITTTVRAQEAGTAGSTLEEVLVTAQRRETALSDTPIAVSAVDAETIAKQGLTTVADLARTVPGLTIPGASLNNNPAVAIRGITFFSAITTVSYPVAYYTDGLFSDRPYSVLDHLFDLERIEVLRGPQGVLFGRNATAGAILIQHRLPTDTWQALARVEAGDFGTERVQASVRGPLIENKLQLGLAGNYSTSDGYAKNVVTGNDVFGEDSHGFRATLRYLPSERFEVILRGDYTSDWNSYGIKNIAAFGSDFERAFSRDPALREYQLANEYEGFTDRQSWSTSLQTTYEFDNFDFITLSGYRQFHQDSHGDSDGSAQVISQNEQRNVDYSSYSTEWRLSGDVGQRWKWDTGVYYIRENPHEFNNEIRMYQTIGGVPVRRTGNDVVNNEVKTDAYAGFGHVTYSLTDRLALRAGLRYTYETKHFDLVIRNYAAGVPTTAVSNVERNWTATTPLLGMDFRWNDDLLLYATASEGFKSGGFNITTGNPPFDPEQVWNYEAGLKAGLWNRTAQLNVSAFYTDYQDMQVSRNIVGGLALIQNAASSTIQGIEIEGSLLPPIDGLRVDLSFAWLDAKYDDFILDDRAPVTSDIGGTTMNRAPEWKGSLSLDYARPIFRDFEIDLRAVYSFESAIYFEALPEPVRSEFRRPAIDNLDLRIGFAPANGRWELAAVARNVTDEQYFSNIQSLLGGSVHAAFFAKPRYLGLEASVNF